MAIPLMTVIQLTKEVILMVSDLVDFDKDTLQQIADNLHWPGGRITNPSVGAVVGATIPTPPFVFGANLQNRLYIAYDFDHFYETIGRPLTVPNIQWDPVMRHFRD